MSAWWTTSRKWITAAWFILPNLFRRVIDQAFGLGHSVEMALSFLAVAVRAGVLLWLWRPSNCRIRRPVNVSTHNSALEKG